MRQYKGWSYGQILTSSKLLFGFRFGHGGGAIFDDAGGGNHRFPISSAPGRRCAPGIGGRNFVVADWRVVSTWIHDT